MSDLQYQDINTCLWDKSTVYNERKIEGYTIISGHTPVQVINPKLAEPKILKRNGTIYIDCGCGTCEIQRLGCLRLEDLKEYYI